MVGSQRTYRLRAELPLMGAVCSTGKPHAILYPLVCLQNKSQDSPRLVRASARMPAAGRVVTVISFSYTAHLCEPQWHIALEHAAERLHAHSHIRDIAHEPTPATHLPPPRDSPAHRVVLSHSARPSPSPPPRRRPRALSRECAIEVARLQARGLSGGGLALRGERHGAAAARRGGALRAREGEPARWHIRPLRELHEPVGW